MGARSWGLEGSRDQPQKGCLRLRTWKFGSVSSPTTFLHSPILYVTRLKGCSSQRKNCHTSTVKPVRSRDSRHCNSSVADPFSESGEDCRPVGNATELQHCEAPSQAILLLSISTIFLGVLSTHTCSLLDDEYRYQVWKLNIQNLS
jgi:hypothetical protein